MRGIIASVVDRLLSPLRVLSAWFLVVSATLFLGGMLTLAALVPNKTLAVVLSVLGGLVAGFVYALNIPKALLVQTDHKVDQLKKQNDEQMRKLRKFLEENASLEAEVNRLRTMQINIDAYTPVLKLGLLDMPSRLRDFHHEPNLDWSEYQKGIIGFRKQIKKQTESYVVLSAKFRAQLGVDLNSLRFKETANGRVRIFGFKSDFQGFSNIEITKELALLVETERDLDWGQIESCSVTSGHGRALKKGDEMQSDLLRRLNQGQGFEHLDENIKRLLKAFLVVIFAPLRLQVEIAEGEEAVQGESFVEFLQEKNSALDAQIRELVAKQQSLVEPSKSVVRK